MCRRSNKNVTASAQRGFTLLLENGESVAPIPCARGRYHVVPEDAAGCSLPPRLPFLRSSRLPQLPAAMSPCLAPVHRQWIPRCAARRRAGAVSRAVRHPSVSTRPANRSSLLRQLQHPATGIGPGWRSFFCANTPLLFHRLPQRLRLDATAAIWVRRRAGSRARRSSARFRSRAQPSLKSAQSSTAVSRST